MEHEAAITTELALLAADLEAFLNITPDAALRRDVAISTRIRRIREVLLPALESAQPAGASRAITFVIQDPENARTHGGRTSKSFVAWKNTSSSAFTISRVTGLADVDDYTFTLYVGASATDIGTANDSVVASVACSNNGTGVYYGEATSFTTASIEPGQCLIWEHTSGTAESLTVIVEGAFA